MDPKDRERLDEIHAMLTELLEVLREYKPMLKRLQSPRNYWKKSG